jgi:hypothetical protein
MNNINQYIGFIFLAYNQKIFVSIMEHNAKSLRPFIGSKNYNQSRQFYQDLGFTEVVLSPVMSLFQNKTVGFYLQDAYVKDKTPIIIRYL